MSAQTVRKQQEAILSGIFNLDHPFETIKIMEVPGTDSNVYIPSRMLAHTV